MSVASLEEPRQQSEESQSKRGQRRRKENLPKTDQGASSTPERHSYSRPVVNAITI